MWHCYIIKHGTSKIIDTSEMYQATTTTTHRGSPLRLTAEPPERRKGGAGGRQDALNEREVGERKGREEMSAP